MTWNEIAREQTEAPRILVVDDDVQLAAGLVKALRNQGYVVRSAHQGTQALEEVGRFAPDLVVLDVMMPGMDGWDVLRSVRGRPDTATVPVIMLTAADSEAAKVQGFSLGADDYVTKPFSLQVLRCRIAAVLRRSGTPGRPEESTCCIQVVSGRAGLDLIPADDVHYLEGIRNYTYVHTFEARHLSRLTLGAVDEREICGFMRVHRSFIVNLDHVRGCGWVRKGAFHVRLDDGDETEIPVSRSLVPEVQRRLGLKE